MNAESLPDTTPNLSEQVFLAALMLEDARGDPPQLVAKYAPIVDPSWFADDRNKAIYEAILAVHQSGGVASLVAVGEALLRAKAPVELWYLAEVSEKCASPYIEAPWHLKKILDAYSARVLRAQCSAAVNATLGGGATADQVAALRAAMDRLECLALDDGPTEDDGGAKNLSVQFLDRLQKWVEEPGSGWGWPTGIQALEDLGLRLYPEGQYLVIAGEPNVGKSTLAAQIALNVASFFRVKKLPHWVGVIAIEDGRERWVNRAMANLSDVSLNAMRKGALDAAKIHAINETARVFAMLPLIVESHPGLNLDRMEGVIQSLVDRGCNVILIDYLQEITDSKLEIRERVTKASRAIKSQAIRENLSMIVVSSLKKLDGRRPTMDDLKESGDIAYGATEVVAAREIQKPDKPSLPTVIGLDVLKQKDGAKGERYCNLHGPTFRISTTDFRPEPQDTDSWKADSAKRKPSGYR